MTTVGILGGGQLAHMMALSGAPLGLRFLVMDTVADACAGQFAPLLVGDYRDESALAEFAGKVDVATFDFENVPAESAEWLSARVPVFPNPRALAVAQDRLAEKTLFRELDIPVPEFAAVASRQDLDRAVADEQPRDTWLELDMAGRDPDEGPTKIPYEKGSLFLRLIEAKVGRERFDSFLRSYFDTFAFESMDTATFLAHLRAELLEPAGVSDEDLQLEAWVHGPGVPPNAPEFASDAFDRVDAQVAALVGGADVASLDTEGWVSQQWVHFVRSLPVDGPATTLAAVDEAFGFSGSGNIEIATAWLELAAESGHAFEAPAVDRALAELRAFAPAFLISPTAILAASSQVSVGRLFGSFMRPKMTASLSL